MNRTMQRWSDRPRKRGGVAGKAVHRRIVRGGAALFLAVATTSGCRSGDAQELRESGPSVVRTEAVIEEDLVFPIRATGTVGPRDEVSLGFKVGGVIERVLVDEGWEVKAGQPLAQLELGEIDAAVTRARSAAAKADRDLERAKRLYADSVVALAQLQDAETAAEVARADLDAASFNRRYAVITAPAAGVILSRAGEPGELVSSGTEVLVLGSRARGTVVRVGLPDRDVLRVARGNRAKLVFDALARRVFEGTVSEIGGAAQPGTGTYTVEISVREGGELAAGLVGSAEIEPQHGMRAALVPIEAVLEADGDAGTVFVLSAGGDRAERRRIRLARLDGDRVAVVAGLRAGERVVTDGAAYLDDGAKVRVVQ